MNFWGRSLIRLFTLFLLLTGIIGNPALVLAADAYIPSTTVQGAIVPDWAQTSFASFPALQDSGSVVFPAAATNQLGYNPSRSWQPGSSIADVLTLGDVQDAFGLETFSLNNVAQLSGLNLSNASLSNFPLIKQQTINSLVQAVPGLGNLSLEQVKPFKDLVTTNLTQVGGGQLNLSTSLSAVANDPLLGGLSFGTMPVDQYSFIDIPGIDQVPLSSLQNWQSAFINGVPGLSNIAFSQILDIVLR